MAFNLYFERDPTLDPNAQSCPNPPFLTNIKCVFWGVPVSKATATNDGQYRDSFQVVIAGEFFPSQIKMLSTDMSLQDPMATTSFSHHLRSQAGVIQPPSLVHPTAPLTLLVVIAPSSVPNSSPSASSPRKSNTSPPRSASQPAHPNRPTT